MPTQVQQFIQLPALKTATNEARKQQFLGRSFRVVPAVLVRSQVLRNNLGTTFLPAEEITDEWAALWNGIPVLVGPHPSQSGVASTGRTPEIWNSRAVGWIFGAHTDTAKDGSRRLVGEVWLDESRGATVEGFQAVLSALDAGNSVELSTGFPTGSTTLAGSHNGEAYEMTLQPAGADHLVISLDMTGACSVSDGCGLGVNCECGGKCKNKKKDDALAAVDAPPGSEKPASEVPTPAVQSHNQEEQMAENEKGLGDLAAAVASLTKLIENAAADIKAVGTKVEAVSTKVDAMEKQGAPAEIAGLKKTVNELAVSFEQSKAVTKAAIDERERERQYFVRELAGNHRVPFNSSELESKPLEELRKLAEMAQVASFAGKGGPQGGNADNEQRFAKTRNYFEKDDEKGGK